jgi:hypothetical protein
MKRILTIVYHWHPADETTAPVAAHHAEALAETALTQIGGYLVGGLVTSGVLADNVHFDERDPEDGVAYVGSWVLTEQDLDQTDWDNGKPTPYQRKQ